MMIKKLHVALTLLFLLPAFAVSAGVASFSDRAKEKRWEQQIAHDLVVGKAVKLEANGVDFLALHAVPPGHEARGAVIVLHGNGVHPAWPDVIEPLRIGLPDRGWQTLSLQMPVLPTGAVDRDYAPLFPEVPSRIQAGVDYLKSKGVDTIVLTGHSLGAAMATYYLANGRDPAVKGFVIVSGGPGEPKVARMNVFRNLSGVKGLSVLDLYGSEDRAVVMDSVIKRDALHLERQGNRYAIHALKGADHFYRGEEEELVSVFADWIDRNVAP